MTFGEKIQKLRKEAGLSQEELSYQLGLFVGGLSLSFWDAEISMILFMVVVILGIILLFSVKLADNPYRKIWKESLSFDKTVKSELTAVYADKKKLTYILNLVGITLIAIGFLLCPMIVPAEMYV